jgi:hypothetical protein
MISPEFYNSLSTQSAAPLPTLSGSQFAQQTFQQNATTVNPESVAYFPAPSITAPTAVTATDTSTIYAPSTLAAQESGAIGAASISSQMASPTTSYEPAPTMSLPSYTYIQTYATPTGYPSTFTREGITFTWDPANNRWASPYGVFTKENIDASIRAGYTWNGNNLVLSNTPPAPTTSTIQAPPILTTQTGSTSTTQAPPTTQVPSTPTTQLPSTSVTTSQTSAGATEVPSIDPFLNSKLQVYTNAPVGSQLRRTTFFFDPNTQTVLAYNGTTPEAVDPAITKAVLSGQAVISNGIITNKATSLSAGTSEYIGSSTALSRLPQNSLSTFDTTTQRPAPQNAPTISAPPITETQKSSATQTTAAMGGTAADQAIYRTAIEKLTTALARAKADAERQRGTLGASYESQIRKAGREMYNQKIKALASLAARGIVGSPGLSTAYKRAGMAPAAEARTALIGEREQRMSALNIALERQLADYEAELRRNQEQLTRATTLANQLTGTGE